MLHQTLSSFSKSCLIFSLFALAACSGSGGSGGATASAGVGPLAQGSISPALGLPGTLVLIEGQGFSATLAANVVKFGGGQAFVQVATTTQILAIVPESASTGPVEVISEGRKQILPPFTVLSSVNAVVDPKTKLPLAKAPVGSTFEIVGHGFDASDVAKIEVTLNGAPAPVLLADKTFIDAVVPVGATGGPIAVSIGGVSAPGAISLVVPPSLLSFSPTSGVEGSTVKIQGHAFSSNPADNQVKFGGVLASVLAASYGELEVVVPTDALTGVIEVTVGAEKVDSSKLTPDKFTVIASGPPLIYSLVPPSASQGSAVTIKGKNFSPDLAKNSVQFVSLGINAGATTPATVTSMAPNPDGKSLDLGITVPYAIADGDGPLFDVQVTVDDGLLQGTSVSGPATQFTVQYNPPTISGFSPQFGPKGTQVTIDGDSFAQNLASNTVKFGSYNAAPLVSVSSDGKHLVCNVPAAIPDLTPPLLISVTTSLGTATSSFPFQVLYAPVISDFLPKSGPPGATVRITGSNFPTLSSANPILDVKFGGQSGTVLSSTPTSILVTVPVGAASGPVTITTNDSANNLVGGPVASSASFTLANPRFAFAVNANDATVSQYLSDSSSGKQLANGYLFTGTQINTGTTGTGTPATAPKAIAAMAVGANSFVYLANSSSHSIAGYSVSSRGLLSALTPDALGNPSGTGKYASNVSTPIALAVHPTLRVIYAANSAAGGTAGAANTLSQIAVSGTGGMSALGANAATGTGPNAIAIDGKAATNYLYVTNGGSNNVSSFRLSGTGSLVAIGGSPFATGTAPSAVLAHPSLGVNYVYVANSGSNSVSVYTSASGVLTPSSPATVAVGVNPSALAMDPTGRFLYVIDKGASGASDIWIFDATTGKLNPPSSGPQTISIPASGATAPNASSASVDPSGILVVTASGAAEELSYRIDPVTGALTLFDIVRARPGAAGLARVFGAAAAKTTALAAYAADSGTMDIGFSSIDANGSLGATSATGVQSTAAYSALAVNSRSSVLYSILVPANPAPPAPPTSFLTFVSTTISPTDGFPGTIGGANQILFGSTANGFNYKGKAVAADYSGLWAYMVLDKFENATGNQVGTSFAFLKVNPGNLPSGINLNNSQAGQWTGGANTTFDNGGIYVDGTIPALGKGQSIALDASGQFCYIANPGTDNISVFRNAANPNPVTATMHSNLGLVATTPNLAPSVIVLHPSGKFAYVLFANSNLVVYPVNVAGTLDTTPANGQTISLPTAAVTTSASSMAVDPLGKFLYVLMNDGSVDGFLVNPIDGSAAAGKLTGPVNYFSPSNFITAATKPFSLTVDPTGGFLYVANSDPTNGNNLAAFSINPGSGALSDLNATPPMANSQPKACVSSSIVQ